MSLRQSLLQKSAAMLLVAAFVVAGMAGCQTDSSTQPEVPESSGKSGASEEIVTAPELQDAETALAGMRTFEIVPEGTEARFLIGEILMGDPKTVVGVTSDVIGQIQVDPDEPQSALIRAIRINARDLTTDNSRRNGAIRRFILQSDRDDYQHVEFVPTSIEGLPESVAIGEPFSVRVTGDLTIRDVTQSETFDMTVTAISEDQLAGLATTTVQRADYELTIPSVPSVAGVEEEVRLELEFTALATE